MRLRIKIVALAVTPLLLALTFVAVALNSDLKRAVGEGARLQRKMSHASRKEAAEREV